MTLSCRQYWHIYEAFYYRRVLESFRVNALPTLVIAEGADPVSYRYESRPIAPLFRSPYLHDYVMSLQEGDCDDDGDVGDVSRKEASRLTARRKTKRLYTALCHLKAQADDVLSPGPPDQGIYCKT
eukprot:GHVU01029579.1.p2 GENE.GHVU01029579.1~~GHVU01029579.1.p2  ORF type:complete len:126 (+),score=11.24 GHVU01029579.1:303-680(+)